MCPEYVGTPWCEDPFFTPSGALLNNGGGAYKINSSVLWRESLQPLRCRVPQPSRYVSGCRDAGIVPQNNVPPSVHALLKMKGRQQNWLVKPRHSSSYFFPGGSTCGPTRENAVSFAALLKSLGIHGAAHETHWLDIGAGVQSVDADLSQLTGMQTLGVAPMDQHASQTYLSTERGLPTLVDRLGVDRPLSLPDHSVHAIHCCWCRIDGEWLLRDLVRVLKPGGIILWDTRHSSDTNAMWSAASLAAVGLRPLKTNLSTRLAANPINGFHTFRLGGNASPTLTTSRPLPAAFAQGGVQVAQFLEKRLAPLKACHATSVLHTSAAGAAAADVPLHMAMSIVLLEAVRRWTESQASGDIVRVTKVVSPSWLSPAEDGEVHGPSWGRLRDGAVVHEWCSGSLRAHPRAYDVLAVGSFLEVVSCNHGATSHAVDAATTNATNLLLEFDRLLRPGGFYLLTHHGAKDALLAHWATRTLLDVMQATSLGCQTISLARTRGRTTIPQHTVCVLQRE